jgi:hypothetical protein
MTDIDLTQLGREIRGFDSPETAILERVSNPHPDTLYLARFAVPEFTSLCPVTSQPDFAHLVIDYAPDKWLIESELFSHVGHINRCCITPKKHCNYVATKLSQQHKHNNPPKPK